jgi:endonuclease/exonuclease/phosphatase family metal-dependent hydrolase
VSFFLKTSDTSFEMKILLYNLAYCTGVDGSTHKYISHGLRHFVGSLRRRKTHINDLHTIIEREQPDVCCFVEVDSDSPLIDRLLHKYKYTDISNKYRAGSIFSKAPFYKKKSLCILSKFPFGVQRHYFTHGFKRLLTEAKFHNGFSLFLSHNSLRPWVRKRQFHLISLLAGDGRKKVITCGDYNILAGTHELEPLRKRGMKLANNPTDFTFPAHRPRKTLDVFLCSDDIRVKRIRALKDVRLSDHLPVVLEVESGHE